MRVEPPAPNASEAERFDYESYTHASEDRYRIMHGSPLVDENYHILILATTLAVHFLVMELWGHRESNERGIGDIPADVELDGGGELVPVRSASLGVGDDLLYLVDEV